MLTKVIMPSGGQTTDEFLLLKWHKKVGDAVKRGDVLFEIETDKATMEVESYGEGILLATYYDEGEYVTAGEVVAYIGEEGEKFPERVKESGSVEAQDEYRPAIMRNDNDVKTLDEAFDKADESDELSDNEEFLQDSGKILASPAARDLAKKGNISLEDVAKHYPKQVIKREDVEKYIQKAETGSCEDYYYIDTSPIRKAIAMHMVESISTAPHFTISMDIDMTEAVSLREALNEYLKDSGIKVSFNDIIIKCASKAIEKYPLINSAFCGDRIKVYKNVNFGLAVGMENGIVVPVVKKANKKSISEIARENSDNIKKAKDGKLQLNDMSGGTITLSNLGMYGVDRFTAIINQPESCILAVGQIAEKPVCINGQVLVRRMMTITASFDHRVIDGALGAVFLREVKMLLENPKRLLA